MKKIIYSIAACIFSFSISQAQCDLKLMDMLKSKSQTEGNTYLKDFQFEFPSKGIKKYSLILNANANYRFYLGISNKYPSEVVFSILDRKNSIKELTNKDGIEYVDFKPDSTQTFHLFIKNLKDVKSCGVLYLALLNGNISKNQDPSKKSDDEVYTTVDEMPEFKKGDNMSFMTWISQNLKYPEVAKKKGIQGKIYVSFIINKEGRMTNIKIVRGINPDLDAYTIEFFKTCPLWEKPGKNKNKPVDVAFTVPVAFALK